MGSSKIISGETMLLIMKVERKSKRKETRLVCDMRLKKRIPNDDLRKYLAIEILLSRRHGLVWDVWTSRMEIVC